MAKTRAVRARYVDIFGCEPQAEKLVDDVAVLFYYIRGTTYAVTDGVHRAHELEYHVKGRPERTTLVKALVTLGRRNLGGVARDVAIPGFPAMTCARLEVDALGHQPAGLSGLGKKLLTVRPMYPAEANALETRGEKELADTLCRVPWGDPKRKPFAGAAPTRKKPPKGKTGWDAVLAQLYTKDPVAYDALVEKKGATPTQLAALPDSLRDTVKRFNGGAPIFEYRTMSAANIVRRRTALRKLETWHRAWTPFAEDGGGNVFAVDLKGHVIAWEIRGHEFSVRATSVKALLAEFVAELRSKR